MIPAFYTFAKGFLWLMLRTLWRYRAVHAERVPGRGPVIVACNHVSYLDPPALGVGVRRPVTYMAKLELFRIPVLGPVITWLGAFPVDRSRGDVAAIKSAARALEAGACLGIFPEGTRNRDGTGKAQMGVALLASLSGAPVVPAYVSGTSAAKRLAPITVTYGEPMVFPSGRKASREDLANWTHDLMGRIYALRENPGAN